MIRSIGFGYPELTIDDAASLRYLETIEEVFFYLLLKYIKQIATVFHFVELIKSVTPTWIN